MSTSPLQCLQTECAYRVVDALDGGAGVASRGREAILPDYELVHVDDDPDQGLEDHGGKQVHVDAGNLVLAKLPGR